MSGQPFVPTGSGRAARAAFAATHRGVVDRLADPYLTDHDRWVLRQFARFLSGLAPEPDPRVHLVRTERPLYMRVRRSRV